MSAPKHTAGEWSAAAKPSSFVGWPVVSRPLGRMICDVSLAPRGAAGLVSQKAWQDYYDEVEANARLIAAAPDLLEALRYAEHTIVAMRPTFSQVKDEGHAYHDQVLDAVRAAIAKATGEGAS